jgi:hypothetical protein
MELNLLKNAGKVLRFIIECAPEDDTDAQYERSKVR